MAVWKLDATGRRVDGFPKLDLVEGGGDSEIGQGIDVSDRGWACVAGTASDQEGLPHGVVFVLNADGALVGEVRVLNEASETTLTGCAWAADQAIWISGTSHGACVTTETDCDRWHPCGGGQHCTQGLCECPNRLGVWRFDPQRR